nr:hypothetical protein [Nostoc sp. ChiSLP03a]
MITRIQDTEAEPSGPPWPLSNSELAQARKFGIQQLKRNFYMIKSFTAFFKAWRHSYGIRHL